MKSQNHCIVIKILIFISVADADDGIVNDTSSEAAKVAPAASGETPVHFLPGLTGGKGRLPIPGAPGGILPGIPVPVPGINPNIGAPGKQVNPNEFDPCDDGLDIGFGKGDGFDGGFGGGLVGGGFGGGVDGGGVDGNFGVFLPKGLTRGLPGLPGSDVAKSRKRRGMPPITSSPCPSSSATPFTLFSSTEAPLDAWIPCFECRATTKNLDIANLSEDQYKQAVENAFAKCSDRQKKVECYDGGLCYGIAFQADDSTLKVEKGCSSPKYDSCDSACNKRKGSGKCEVGKDLLG